MYACIQVYIQVCDCLAYQQNRCQNEKRVALQSLFVFHSGAVKIKKNKKKFVFVFLTSNLKTKKELCVPFSFVCFDNEKLKDDTYVDPGGTDLEGSQLW